MGRSLSPEDLDALFAMADLGVRAGLAGEDPPRIDVATVRPALREPGGVFVTLEVAGALNGCIGTIVASEPLGVAVPRLAWRAAFADPRLPALTAEEYPSLEYKLSLIGPLAPMTAGSEAELAAELRPGVDGLLLRWGTANATFLPAVWKKVDGDPAAFLGHLWAKAGLRPGQWPRGMEAWRYESTDYRRAPASPRDHPPSGAPAR